LPLVLAGSVRGAWMFCVLGDELGLNSGAFTLRGDYER
jgi:hypothetical protein